MVSPPRRRAARDGPHPRRRQDRRSAHDPSQAGALTPAEHDLIKNHAMLGAAISAEVLSDEQIGWLRGHHERWDGTGYPDELRGDAIPEGARLLCVADCWDAMTSPRTYSKSMNATQAIAECQRASGSQFSPEIVEILSRPGFERVLRLFANEQATRDRNEARLAGDEGSVFRLHCECGAEDCPTTVEIAADDYRAVRLSERCYIVAARPRATRDRTDARHDGRVQDRREGMSPTDRGVARHPVIAASGDGATWPMCPDHPGAPIRRRLGRESHRPTVELLCSPQNGDRPHLLSSTEPQRRTRARSVVSDVTAADCDLLVDAAAGSHHR